MDKLLAANVDGEAVVAEEVGTKKRVADCCKDARPLVRATFNVQGDRLCAVHGDWGAVGSRERTACGVGALLNERDRDDTDLGPRVDEEPAFGLVI